MKIGDTVQLIENFTNDELFSYPGIIVLSNVPPAWSHSCEPMVRVKFGDEWLDVFECDIEKVSEC